MLAPFALPLALVAQLFSAKGTIDRTPDEVAGFIKDFLDGRGGEWDWDEFESVPIADPELEAIRRRATTPGVDLREVLMEAQRLVAARLA